MKKWIVCLATIALLGISILGAGNLDAEFETLKTQIQACEVSDQIKTYTLGFVDIAKPIIDTPGQLTFVSRKELEIVKCIVAFFYPLSAKKKAVMATLNLMLTRLQESPVPSTSPTDRAHEPIEPPQGKCTVEIGVTDNLQVRRVSDDLVEVLGLFQEVYLNATANESGSFEWYEIDAKGNRLEFNILSDQGRVGLTWDLSGRDRGIGLELNNSGRTELAKSRVFDTRIVVVFTSADGQRMCEDSITLRWKR